MFEKLKNAVSHLNVKFYLALFLFAWMVGWVLKALYGYQFDLDKLVDLYKWLLGQFAIESGLNTEIPVLKQIKGGQLNETGDISGTKGSGFTGQE